MTIKEAVRGALHRVAGTKVPAFFIDVIRASRSRSAGAVEQKRRTVALPSALTHTPRADALPKPTPANLRKFAETPVARKAINTIKDRIAGMRWRVQARRGRSLEGLPDAGARVQALTDTLDQPNPEDRKSTRLNSSHRWTS